MGSALARAHTQDFERRKDRAEAGTVQSDDEDDDDDSSYPSEDENQTPPQESSTSNQRNPMETLAMPSGSMGMH